MIAMHYPIALPADYDMGIIRRRVAARGPSFDDRPGLLFKAFLISERAAGAPLNQYAPFYVWRGTDALWDFVAGDGFAGIVESFGRPAILTWLPWSLEQREGFRQGSVRTAIREDLPIPIGASLPAIRQAELEANRAAMAEDPGLALRVVAVNIERWTLVRFGLRSDRTPQLPPGAQAFEVLHLSMPGQG